jgi:propanediol dehydratase large subunit
MQKLDLMKTPRWLELFPGKRVKVRPLTTSMLIAARKDPAVAELPEDADDNEAALAMAKALARRAIVEWEGITDYDDEPLELSPEAVDFTIERWPYFQAFQTLYVARGMVLEAEKNGSLPLPNGTSAGATDTAQPAEQPVPTAPPG